MFVVLTGKMEKVLNALFVEDPLLSKRYYSMYDKYELIQFFMHCRFEALYELLKCRTVKGNKKVQLLVCFAYLYLHLNTAIRKCQQ